MISTDWYLCGKTYGPVDFECTYFQLYNLGIGIFSSIFVLKVLVFFSLLVILKRYFNRETYETKVSSESYEVHFFLYVM